MIPRDLAPLFYSRQTVLVIILAPVFFVTIALIAAIFPE